MSARRPGGAKLSSSTWAAVALFVIVLVGGGLRVACNDVSSYSNGDEEQYAGNTRRLVREGWSSYPGLVRAYLATPSAQLYPSPLRYGYLAMTRAACGVREPCDRRTLAWLSTLAGIAALGLTFVLGRRLVGERAALLAAALSVSSPLQLGIGRRALQDEVLCALILAALWAIVRLAQDHARARDASPPASHARIREAASVALFVALATLAFTVKEAFAFTYAGIVAVYFAMTRRLRLRDALMFAAPPLLFVAGFAALDHGLANLVPVVEATRGSFASLYTQNYQSGPPHRALIDLVALSPIVFVIACGAATSLALGWTRAAETGGAPPAIAARSSTDDARGAGTLALFFAVLLLAFAPAPKNLRFVVIFDPVARLLAAWALTSLGAGLRFTHRAWLAAFLVANAAVELVAFHRVFVVANVPDATTHNILAALGALPPAHDEGPKAASPTPELSDFQLMNEGLEALYRRHDPAAAAEKFQRMLARNPEHYGATYQLARALDQLNRGNEALPLWEKVLRQARKDGDQKTAEFARARLAAPR